VKPPPFEYEDPRELDAALALLAEKGEDAKVLAGGQSLVPLLNFRLARPAVLVDINRVPGLAGIRAADGVLRIGALTRQATLERSPVVARRWPLLSHAVRWVAHPQIRNRGTVGGSVAHADPAAELPVALTALDARFEVRSARGSRTLGCSDFFVGQLQTALEPDELLTAIVVPRPVEPSGAAFAEFARRHGDFALGGAAVDLALEADGSCGRASIALLAAGATPIRATAAERSLQGRRPDEDAAREAAALSVDGVAPTGDMHGSSGYRRGVIEAMVRDAVLAAAERAREVAT
jgi:CO/xanthine dehydrogenase FAD-binding subunit